MSKKPFNREKAKIALENFILESVQKYFDQENERVRLKNQSKIKIHEDNQKMEEFLKTFENMRVKIRNVLL